MATSIAGRPKTTLDVQTLTFGIIDLWMSFCQSIHEFKWFDLLGSVVSLLCNDELRAFFSRVLRQAVLPA